MENMNLLPDESLVAEYAAGHNVAFDILLKRHESKVFTYILSYVKDRHLANDIFQDTFFKAIITIRQKRYAENGKFSAWIMRIARNLIIDYFRRQKSENLLSTDSTDINILNNKDLSEGTIEDQLSCIQLSADIQRIVAALPDIQKEVLTMRYYQDMPFKDIAEQTNVSINTALGRMRYALQNMRRIAVTNNISLSV